jgi:hypothetical protein
MKLEKCNTEADFFGWFYNECKKQNKDLHWKDAMECTVPTKYSKILQHAIMHHVYGSYQIGIGDGDTVTVGTDGYYAYGS